MKDNNQTAIEALDAKMSENSPRSWSAFSRGSGTPNNSSLLQSSSASVYSLRKRSSFFHFGRSRSDASKARQQVPPLQPTTEPIDEESVRPPTAHSTQTARSRKEPFNALRHTILGSRRRNPEDQLESVEDFDSRPTNRSEPLLQTSPSLIAPTREEFKSGDQYYRHLRKQSISTPFNFEHRAHTARTQLPPLETVDERDLKREFWTASARHRPRRHLHGISAEDIPKHQIYPDAQASRPVTAKSQPVSPLSPSDEEDDPPHIATPIEPIARMDETIFDDVAKSGAARVDSARTPPHQESAKILPRRHSSLNALKLASNTIPRPSGPPATFYESDSSNNSLGDGTAAVVPESGPHQTLPVETASSPTVPGKNPKQEEVEFRSTQPLPPVPGHASIKRYRNNSLRQAESTLGPSASLRIPAQQTGSPISKRSSKRGSSRSSRSIRQSPSQASSSDLRQSVSVSDTTWEDDVDFIYEQEAESTCDFNWSNAQTSRTGSEESSGSTAAVGASFHAHSPPAQLESILISPFNHNKETIAERRSSRRGDEPSRASSVGHRGFLAARRSSQDLTRLPNPTQITPDSSHASLLSPVFSVSGADEREDQKPYTPTVLHYSTCANSDFLSDPESCRNSGSTRHRKSSSYGSHESRARAPPVVTRDNTTRWSVASANSLPELTHSRPRSKLILSKTIISKPLETLPQSPPYGIERGEDSPIVPREFQVQPVRQSFLMRRPQTLSDRAVLHAAGRTVQERGSRTVSPPQVPHEPPADYGVRNIGLRPSGWI